MGEEISSLVDGELDDDHTDVVNAQLRRPEGRSEWACYHIIGDTLRGTPRLSPGFDQRFAARLAAEPTVLAPRPKPPGCSPFVWAVAATLAAVGVVGWVAFGTLDPQSMALAQARESATVRAAAIKPRGVPADYLLAHREVSPREPIPGVGTYLRPATATTVDPRP